MRSEQHTTACESGCDCEGDGTCAGIEPTRCTDFDEGNEHRGGVGAEAEAEAETSGSSSGRVDVARAHLRARLVLRGAMRRRKGGEEEGGPMKLTEQQWRGRGCDGRSASTSMNRDSCMSRGRSRGRKWSGGTPLPCNCGQRQRDRRVARVHVPSASSARRSDQPQPDRALRAATSSGASSCSRPPLLAL